MAASNFVVLNTAKLKGFNGTIDFDSHTFKAALMTEDWTPTAATTTDTYAELNATGFQVANGNGYTTGGATLGSIALTETSGTVKFTSAAPSWSSATFDAKWIVVYSDTATNKDIVGYMDLNTASSSAVVSPTNGTLTVTWHANGMFTMT